MDEITVVIASRGIAAPAERVFELVADPRLHPTWDGNDNLDTLIRGERVRAVGDVFVMRTTKGNVRDNLVVALEEGRVVAWRPGDEGGPPAGHEWRWEVEAIDEDHCRVTHTYDWTDLTDERRLERARSTSAANLTASLDRLAEIAEAATG